VAPEGSEKLGTRVEIKNLNSFKSIERAAQHEFERQVEAIENGDRIIQETRGWNDDAGKTTSQRSKEDAQDYRYMPEPDVPPIVLTEEFVSEIEAEMPLMPGDYRKTFAAMKLDESEITSILNYPLLAERLATVLAQSSALAVRVAHWFSGVLLAEENIDKDFELATVAELTELSEMVEKNELSSTAGKEIFLALYDAKNTEKTPRALAKEMNLLQENDESALSRIIDEVLALPECAKATRDVKKGEMKAIGFLVGQVMKKSGGKANPSTVNQLIQKKLE
jgi:aspartyl-tRNA(Asn)/glutamyl-tRNA(Gln) amidotransferase subunit B